MSRKEKFYLKLTTLCEFICKVKKIAAFFVLFFHTDALKMGNRGISDTLPSPFYQKKILLQGILCLSVVHKPLYAPLDWTCWT